MNKEKIGELSIRVLLAIGVLGFLALLCVIALIVGFNMGWTQPWFYVVFAPLAALFGILAFVIDMREMKKNERKGIRLNKESLAKINKKE